MKLLKPFLGAILGAAMTFSSAAMADSDWKPNGTLRVQIAFGAGGSTDTVGRVLAQQIKQQTGWNVIAENKTGGGGVAMFTGISKMPAKGTVIGFGVNEPILVNLVKRGEQLPFNIDSFDYLGTVMKGQMAAVTRHDAPFSNTEEMIAFAQKGNQVTIAVETEGQKSTMKAIADQANVKFSFVTSSGAAESLKMILGGQVMLAFGTGEEIRYIESGDMKVIASAGLDRLSHSPDVETFFESGYEVYIEPVWYLATTKGTPPEALEKLSQVIDAAVQSPDVKKVVNNVLKLDPVNLGPQGTEDMMVSGLNNAQQLFGK